MQFPTKGAAVVVARLGTGSLVFGTAHAADGENKTDRIHRLKYWEIIADDLSKARWSLGWVSAVDCEGRTIWIVDAHTFR